MSWGKQPPVTKANQGCACCPVPSIHASMDMKICAGFGSASAYNDAGFSYYGPDLDGWDEAKTVGDIEEIAKKDPDHDWQIQFVGPLHGETYQRHGDNLWVMIETNEGFA